MQSVWLLPVACALVDWYAVWRGDRRTETWAKPATLVALILVAFVLGAGTTPYGWWLVLALVCGLVGDVFLLEKSDIRFRLGLAAFLLGHLAYVACFIDVGLSHPTWWWLAVPVLAGCLGATREVVPATHRRGGSALSVPVACYTGVICAMLLLAYLSGIVLIAVGATVFATSDTTLALNRFVRPRAWAPLTVMVTYHLGQALIVIGVLRH